MDVVKSVFEDELSDAFFAETFDEFFADLVGERADGSFARKFPRGEESIDNTVAGKAFGLIEDFVGNDVERDLAFALARALGEIALGGDRRPDALVRELHRLFEIVVGNFFGRAFIHDKIGFVADIDEIQIALRHFGVSRIGDEAAIDATDTHGTQWTGPGNIADHERGGGPDQSEHVGIIFAIGAQDDALDLNFIVPALGKERADGSIDQP